MGEKSSFQFRVDQAVLNRFKAACALDDVTPSQALRSYMRAYICHIEPPPQTVKEALLQLDWEDEKEDD